MTSKKLIKQSILVLEEKMNDFTCKQCARCCLETPCIFAQIEYNIHSGDGKICPDLRELEENKYECLAIPRNKEIKEMLIGNGCDYSSQIENKPKFDCSEIVKEYFPKATDEEIDNILWSSTSFPSFWNIPIDGWTAKQCLRTELRKYKYGKNNEEKSDTNERELD